MPLNGGFMLPFAKFGVGQECSCSRAQPTLPDNKFRFLARPCDNEVNGQRLGCFMALRKRNHSHGCATVQSGSRRPGSWANKVSRVAVMSSGGGQTQRPVSEWIETTVASLAASFERFQIGLPRRRLLAAHPFRPGGGWVTFTMSSTVSMGTHGLRPSRFVASVQAGVWKRLDHLLTHGKLTFNRSATSSTLFAPEQDNLGAQLSSNSN